MSNIPGGGWHIPSCDPVRHMTIGTPEGRIKTNDHGSEFVVEGDFRLAALALLQHVTSPNVYGTIYSAYCPVKNKITRLTFSVFDFDFEDGIKIKLIESKKSDGASIILEEMNRLLELKAFF